MKQARVVHVEICEDEKCGLQDPSRPHVLVTPYLVDLLPGRGIAISYTWGDFDRENYCIGHDPDGGPIIVELGKEWHLGDFVRCLHGFCHQAPEFRGSTSPLLWVDQLCINQDDPHEVRSTLASIPDIYKNFETNVLFPGSQCPCFRDQYEVVKRWKGDDTSLKVELLMGTCLNMLSVYTWGTRVWTRQELLYAGLVRAKWVSPSPTSLCPKVDSPSNLTINQFDSWSLPARLWISRAIEESRSRGDGRTTEITAKLQIEEYARQAWSNLLETMVEWATVKMGNPTGNEGPILAYSAAFLAGLLVKSPVQLIPRFAKSEAHSDEGNRPNEDSDNQAAESFQLQQFLRQLCQLGKIRRAATRPRDYVVSVWVDCPRYELPQDFRTISLGELLQDAVAQLHRNFDIVLNANIPLGLLYPSVNFSASIPPHTWGPCHLLDCAPARHLADVYGTLPSEPITFFCEPTFGHGQSLDLIPTHGKIFNSLSDLHLLVREKLAFMENAIEIFTRGRSIRVRPSLRESHEGKVHPVFGDRNTPHWAESKALAWLGHVREKKAKKQLLTDLKNVNISRLGGESIKIELEGGFRLDVDAFIREELEDLLDSIDFDWVAYELTCAALGLQPRAARTAKLRLMVRRNPPMLGLTIHEMGDRLKFMTMMAQFQPDEQAHVTDPELTYECGLPFDDILDGVNRLGADLRLSKSLVPLGIWVPVKLESQPKDVRIHLSPYEDEFAANEDSEWFEVLSKPCKGVTILRPK